jgi:hypothetical protein
MIWLFENFLDLQLVNTLDYFIQKNQHEFSFQIFLHIYPLFDFFDLSENFAFFPIENDKLWPFYLFKHGNPVTPTQKRNRIESRER